MLLTTLFSFPFFLPEANRTTEHLMLIEFRVAKKQAERKRKNYRFWYIMNQSESVSVGSNGLLDVLKVSILS